MIKIAKKYTLIKLSINLISWFLFWDGGNFIRSKLKQIIKFNSQSTQCWLIKLKKNKFKNNSS
jgi:hypothetical protein